MARQTKAVYWRRRIIALLVIALLAVLVVYGVRAAVSMFTAVRETRATAQQSAAKETEIVVPVKCDLANLQLTLSGADATITAGTILENTLTLVNLKPEQPCYLDLADIDLGIVVTSGNDEVWNSATCANDESKRVLLAEGLEYSFNSNWQANRFKECNAGTVLAAGTYRVVPYMSGGEPNISDAETSDTQNPDETSQNQAKSDTREAVPDLRGVRVITLTDPPKPKPTATKKDS
ncbi:MAG: hypothetical protein SOS98_06030 [Varibaculum sp.]|nr:hypothetical protein [Varibaculum sp.]